jgi:hypothetical protein
MYAYLRQHPEIYASPHKEPHFFGTDLTILPGAIREEPLYLELFAGAGDRQLAGESSVWYLLSKKAASEIRAYVPNAKIIVLLRRPEQMAFSLYTLYTRTGNEDLPTFEEALAAEPERRQGRRIPATAYFPEGLQYTDVAAHAAKVERYLDVFGCENVHCILFDDLVRDTAAVYRQTLEFLGVDPGFEAELDPRKANEKIRMTVIRQLARLHPEIRRRLQFKDIRLHEGGPRDPLAEETAERRRQLVAADVARLGALLGRDLSAWMPSERKARAVDDQPLMGAGADDTARSRDLHLEAEQAAVGDFGQPDTDRHLLARAGGADVADVHMGADRGLPLAEEGLDGGEAGVLHESDHAGGRQDVSHVRGAHVGGDPIGGLVAQSGLKSLGRRHRDG